MRKLILFVLFLFMIGITTGYVTPTATHIGLTYEGGEFEEMAVGIGDSIYTPDTMGNYWRYNTTTSSYTLLQTGFPYVSGNMGGVVFTYNNKIYMTNNQGYLALKSFNLDGTNYEEIQTGIGTACNIRPSTDEIWCYTDITGIQKYDIGDNATTTLNTDYTDVFFPFCLFRNTNEFWCVGGKNTTDNTLISNVMVYKITENTIETKSFELGMIQQYCSFVDDTLYCWDGFINDFNTLSKNIYFYEPSNDTRGTIPNIFPFEIGTGAVGRIGNSFYQFGGYETLDFNENGNNTWRIDFPCSVCSETCSPCGGGCTATDMTEMYKSVTGFDATYGDITGWNTSCITNMKSMFAQSDFNQDIGSWDTSNVVDMSNMFQGTDFNQNIGLWDTSKVTDMSKMFESTNIFNQDIGGWNTGQVTNMNQMFYHSDSFNQDIGSWNTSKVTNMLQMLASTSFNQDIGGWDVSNVVTMQGMLRFLSNFNQDLGNWDISSVTGYGLNDFIQGGNLSVSNYDSLLNGWSGHLLESGLTPDFGSSMYSSTGISGRAILTDIYGWTITDGGLLNVTVPTPPTTNNTYVPQHSTNDITGLVIDFGVEMGKNGIMYIPLLVVIGVLLWSIKKAREKRL